MAAGLVSEDLLARLAMADLARPGRPGTGAGPARTARRKTRGQPPEWEEGSVTPDPAGALTR